ncbi:MAG: hypothetical protein EA344_07965 [Alkalicoccus sp.]|nr:MAG: hypothetical protein EA344_07965 [Alkalicoccus sp.]
MPQLSISISTAEVQFLLRIDIRVRAAPLPAAEKAFGCPFFQEDLPAFFFCRYLEKSPCRSFFKQKTSFLEADGFSL